MSAALALSKTPPRLGTLRADHHPAGRIEQPQGYPAPSSVTQGTWDRLVSGQLNNKLCVGVMNQHYLKSSFREKLIEHLFIGELLKHSWLEGTCSLEFAKPEVDNQGYDLIAERDGIIRHIQLKASHLQARTARQKVHTALSRKPSACVVWVFFDEKSMELGPFLFFGGPAGHPLPSIVGFKTARHTKANAEGTKAERPEIREIAKGQFSRYESVQEIYELLFVTHNQANPADARSCAAD